MKKIILSFILPILSISLGFSQGYNVGDKAADFKLKNVDGNFVSLSDYNKAKGIVVIFTCNHCPYAQAYQDRIIKIDKKYKALGYPVIAINPNYPGIVLYDSYYATESPCKGKRIYFPISF